MPSRSVAGLVAIIIYRIWSIHSQEKLPRYDMHIATILTPNGPRAALRRGDEFIDLHATDKRIPLSVRHILDGGRTLLEGLAEVAARADAVTFPAGDVTYLPPVPDPHKIVCLGLNYRDHAAETGKAIPTEPVLFSKYASALIGHDDAIVLPSVSKQVDFEAELVIVIGKRGRHLTTENAMEHVAGYTIGHDVSARDWQYKPDQKQWMVGKTFDTFAPTGPVIVTVDELNDPHNLSIQLRLNGTTMQDSNTSQMIFDVPAILVYLTQVFTLEPGDLIFTGTPPGVGAARKPPVFLKAGDVVEVEIEKVGLLRNHVVNA